MALVKYYISYIVTSAGGGVLFSPLSGRRFELYDSRRVAKLDIKVTKTCNIINNIKINK